MLSVIDATKRFGEHTALSGVSLEVGAATTTALIGPSGCGKSTLLRLMIGLIKPDEGRVEFDGQDLAVADLTSIRRRFGYAIQSGGLFPHMTARRNVEIPALRSGQGGSDLADRVGALASMVHLPQDALDRYPAELSGGQRQRVALMRALVLDPEVLLLDEPLGALDPLIRAELQTELKELFAELGKTVVLVTHDLAEAAYLAADDIVLLKQGRIEQRGPFAAIRDEPKSDFVKAFVAAQMLRVGALTGARS
jgi:osmoprotectant transport system ATP-binding protein